MITFFFYFMSHAMAADGGSDNYWSDEVVEQKEKECLSLFTQDFTERKNVCSCSVERVKIDIEPYEFDLHSELFNSALKKCIDEPPWYPSLKDKLQTDCTNLLVENKSLGYSMEKATRVCACSIEIIQKTTSLEGFLKGEDHKLLFSYVSFCKNQK